jgi:uncharacterized protein (DUF697 family)
MAPTTLWQIGSPPAGDEAPEETAVFLRQTPWTAEFDYRVATDADPTHRPQMPYAISAPDAPKRQGMTEKLNIHFTLERDYAEGKLRLIYGRYGAAPGQIYLDGVLAARVSGTGEELLGRSEIPLGALPRGEHMITITTAGDPENQAHALGYLQLQATEAADGAPAPQDVPSDMHHPEEDAHMDHMTEGTPAGERTPPEPSPESQAPTQDTAVQAARRQEASDLVKNHVIAAMAIGTLPVPVIDFVGLTALQLRMIARLSRLYGVPFRANRGKSIVTSLLGAIVPPSAAGGLASMAKFVPGFGLATGIMAASTIGGASTYAVGRAFSRHFERGNSLLNLSLEDLRQDVQHFIREGEELVAKLRRKVL